MLAARVVIPPLLGQSRLVPPLEGWAPLQDAAALQRFRSGLERELDQRWARNTMLNKWLEYCVERGHRFPQVKATP